MTIPETNNERSRGADCSVPLDPATCLALKPVHDIGNQAVNERDKWNRWAVAVAMTLNVSCSDFASDVVALQYEELRERIVQALNTNLRGVCER